MITCIMYFDCQKYRINRERQSFSCIHYRGLQLVATPVNQHLLFRPTLHIGNITD